MTGPFAQAAKFKDVPVLGSTRLVETANQLLPETKPLRTLAPSSKEPVLQLSNDSDTPLVFDIPVTYNKAVRFWIVYFQTTGRGWFKTWLERSSRYMPRIQSQLRRAGLPQDLAYFAMIESGFSSHAVSQADAVGLWQFMEPTGNRYGLRTEWWLDERRDSEKSTKAAIGYISDLYRLFGSWYMVAASYNMGETRLKKLTKRYSTNNFWKLSELGVLPKETKNYVPKIIAAMLISKAPGLYGFRDLDYHSPQAYEYFSAPPGTDILSLANYLGVSAQYMKDLNPELIHGYIPRTASAHQIRIPKGSLVAVSKYVHHQLGSNTSLELNRP